MRMHEKIKEIVYHTPEEYLRHQNSGQHTPTHILRAITRNIQIATINPTSRIRFLSIMNINKEIAKKK